MILMLSKKPKVIIIGYIVQIKVFLQLWLEANEVNYDEDLNLMVPV